MGYCCDIPQQNRWIWNRILHPLKPGGTASEPGTLLLWTVGPPSCVDLRDRKKKNHAMVIYIV